MCIVRFLYTYIQLCGFLTQFQNCPTMGSKIVLFCYFVSTVCGLDNVLCIPTTCRCWKMGTHMTCKLSKIVLFWGLPTSAGGLLYSQLVIYTLFRHSFSFLDICAIRL